MANNHPTVSNPLIIERYSAARTNERDTLLRCVDLTPGMTVLDIQSAGGYLSDEVFRRLGGRVELVCIEPNGELRYRLKSAYRAINNPVEHFYSVGDNSIDLALGLIGLHHSHSHESTIKEIFRTLAWGGQFAICDVYKGSRLAQWFDEFVHENSASGHVGNFPSPGSISAICIEMGFTDVVEEPKDVPWIFSSRSDIALFFKGLFGLTVSERVVESALENYFTIRDEAGLVSVDWQLMYCHGSKMRHP